MMGSVMKAIGKHADSNQLDTKKHDQFIIYIYIFLR